MPRHVQFICMGLLLFACCARAASIDNCGTRADSSQAPQAPQAVTFGPFRQGILGSDIRARDIEFLWDLTYGPVSSDVQATLINFNTSLVFLTGTNPTAVDAKNLQAVYNLLRREGADWSTNPNDQTSYRVGRESGGLGSPDRAHTDLYIYNPDPADTAKSRLPDGQYPSALTSDNEDLSTGHVLGNVNHDNAIMLRGPLPANSIDLAGTGWTSPNRFSQVRVLHEIQHSMPGPTDFGGSTISELWSAGAEAINGLRDTTRGGEIPYTWSLLAANTLTHPLRGSSWNYAARTSFMAYVGYNFLNADSNRTLAGASDDLMVRWAKLSTRSLAAIKPLLTDAQCATCANRTYFHSGAAELSTRDRLNLILHNWRAANFVNNPTAAERQLGYPSWSGFTPATHQSAWQDFDGDASDDIVSLPAIVTLTSQQLTRDLALEGDRTFRGSTYPMSLTALGANYWVIRADASLQSANRELVIRVIPTGCYACRGAVNNASELALLASAVAYNITDAAGDESVLWQNPGAVSFVSTVRSIETDSPGAIELVLPNFGASNRSALLVLSTGDGRSGAFANEDNQTYFEDVPYRLEIGLRSAPFQASNPLPVAAQSTFAEAAPSWAPNNDEITYSAYAIGPAQQANQIYRRRLDGSPPVAIGAQSLYQFSPSWSPRGDAIAYEGAVIGTALSSNIWIADLAPTGAASLRQLTSLPGCAGMPSFQPNGQGLAYVYIPDPGSPAPVCYLRWVGWDGTGDGQLAVLGTSSNYLRRPRWSPDGKTIYVAMADRADSIYAIPRTGGTPRKILSLSSPAPAFDLHPGAGRLAIQSDLPILNTAKTDPRCITGTTPLGINVPRVGLFDTTIVQAKYSFQAPASNARSQDPAFASNGIQLAYVSVPNGSTNTDILIRQVSWNHAPVFTAGVDDQVLTAAVPFQVTLLATDSDGEPISYRADFLPPGSTLYNGNTFRWLNPLGGTYFVVFRALDGSGGVARRVVRLTVATESGGGDPFRDGDGGCGACLKTGSTAAMTAVTAEDQPSNSYLNGALPGAWFEQTSRLTRWGTDAEGNPIVSLTATLPGSMALDRARLLSVDHAPGTTALATPNGVVIGRLGSMEAVTSESNANWPSDLASAVADSGSLVVPAGTVLTAAWSDPAGPSGLAIDCSHMGAGWGDGTGIDVQTPVAGAWQTVSHLNPRRDHDLISTVLPSGTSARLVFLAPARVRGIHSFAVVGTADDAIVNTLEPLSCDRPEGTTALAQADSNITRFEFGEHVLITYAPPAPTDGFIRSYFLDLRAAYTPPTGAWSARIRPSGTTLPTRFALHQNRPNPFVTGTVFRFDIPQRTHVKLEIFDAQGRRVCSLLDRDFQPGAHAFDWDGRDSRGSLLGPGVYLYRMIAGDSQAKRRLVLLKH